MTFDPWGFLGPKRRRMLDRGWPGLFRKHLLDALPVEKLAPRFHPTHGRPSKEPHTLLGMLLLQAAPDSIVYVEAEPAHCHDGRALEPALESLEKRDLLPKEMSADTSYGREGNARPGPKYRPNGLVHTSGSLLSGWGSLFWPLWARDMYRDPIVTTVPASTEPNETDDGPSIYRSVRLCPIAPNAFDLGHAFSPPVCCYREEKKGEVNKGSAGGEEYDL